MRCRAFTFLVKFGLVLIYVLKVRKNMFNSLLTFFYENYVPFQVLKDFSVENFKNTPSTFFLNFFSEIYLSRIINYCCSIFTLYLTLKAFGLVCLLSAFFLVFLFLLIFFFFFLTDTSDPQDSIEWRVNHYFSCFPLPLAHEYAFNSSRFLSLLFNRSICNYRTDSWWDLLSLEIYILFAFSLMQLSRSYWLSYFKVTLWESELISHFYYKANGLTNWY